MGPFLTYVWENPTDFCCLTTWLGMFALLLSPTVNVRGEKK